MSSMHRSFDASQDANNLLNDNHYLIKLRIQYYKKMVTVVMVHHQIDMNLNYQMVVQCSLEKYHVIVM
ncbi:hypothetical protein KSF78_0009526 [Schistosoma japonicum]|nr:hypothetical protein KSF78_0009526 [Schistosoma japonicum]